MSVATDIARRMMTAGDSLSAGTVQWGNRRRPAPALALTRRDLSLLALTFDVNFLSASQLLAFGWGQSGERAGQRRLTRLHDAGYFDRFRPVSAIGSAEWNYRVTASGWSALVEHGVFDSDRRYTPSALTSISYTEHDLQLAALVLRIAHDVRPADRGPLLDRMPFLWHGPQSGRIDPDELAEHGKPPSPAMQLHPESSRRGYLEPDATLTAQTDAGNWAVLIEYDRTERPHKQIDRFRRYDRWLLDGWNHGRFSAHVTPPSVLFLTARERPLRRLVETADQTFTAWHGRQHAGPREGTHPARHRAVFTSRDRILDGDWTMLRTPSLPPDCRDEPRCIARTVAYSLPSLFA
ncbi:MAG TPA: replication-relaxation family protein [Solirubrobacteraceae bacterium]|nr:replication-relaxation family protein [Solirubrobacteraceae bacterium]